MSDHEHIQGAARDADDPSQKANTRILIVDDSAFMRFTISNRLSETPGFQVVGTARDGQEALELIPSLKPDVITLDVEMPRLDGLSTLRQIMAHNPCPVIMLSSLTGEGARETVQALTWGAVDFIAKPTNKANIEAIMDELVGKIKRAAHIRLYPIPFHHHPQLQQQNISPKQIRQMRGNEKVVVIGSSTGGPRALNTVIPLLPQHLSAPVLIVQHMPVGFTRSLAERLNSLSQLDIKEAAPGDELVIGRALVAPGGFHMILDENNRIALNQNPPVHGVRPAIDVTLSSVAQRFGKDSIAVILTGMGKDGTNGSFLIHSAGGHVIAEDESTCVVWGMPRSVMEAGIADDIVPLPDIAESILKAVEWN